MKKIFACAFLSVLLSACVFAQNQSSPTEYNKREFFVGYSENSIVEFGRVENFDDEEIKSYRGWSGSYTYNFRRFVGIKADVSGHYKDFEFTNNFPSVPVRVKSSIYNFLGGIQIKDNKKSKRFSPFVYALGGFSRTKLNLESSLCSPNPCRETNKGFALAVGGGLDLKIKKNFSIRLIQVDFNPAFYNGFRENRLRAGFGVVIH